MITAVVAVMHIHLKNFRCSISLIFIGNHIFLKINQVSKSQINIKTHMEERNFYSKSVKYVNLLVKQNWKFIFYKERNVLAKEKNILVEWVECSIKKIRKNIFHIFNCWVNFLFCFRFQDWYLIVIVDYTGFMT